MEKLGCVVLDRAPRDSRYECSGHSGTKEVWASCLFVQTPKGAKGKKFNPEIQQVETKADDWGVAKCPTSAVGAPPWRVIGGGCNADNAKTLAGGYVV